MTPSSHVPTSITAARRGPAPERPYVAAAARLGVDPAAVHAALDEFDATVRRREERRRAATRELVAELYARDGVDPAPARVDAEADAACAQEREERLAAELRRLVTPQLTAVRQAHTRSDQDLDNDCQAALNVLATAPRSLAEFWPQVQQSYAAEQASLDGFAQREAHAAGLLEAARGWQRRLRRELDDARRGRTAAEHRRRLAAAKLAAVLARQAQRAEWLAQPKLRDVLGAGAAALRELADRAQVQEGAATAELPAVGRPVAPGGRPGERGRPGAGRLLVAALPAGGHRGGLLPGAAPAGRYQPRLLRVPRRPGRRPARRGADRGGGPRARPAGPVRHRRCGSGCRRGRAGGVPVTAQAAPVVSLALAAGGTVWACRLFHGDQDRCRLLAGVAVTVGVALLNLGGLSRLVGVVGVPVVEVAHLAGWYLGPFALLGAAGYGTYRLVRRWWNAYPVRGLGARTVTVLGSLAVGVAVGVLVRAAPLVSEAAGIARDATAAGVRATARTLLDRVGGAIGLT